MRYNFLDFLEYIDNYIVNMKNTKVHIYKNVRGLNSNNELHVRISDKDRCGVILKTGYVKKVRGYDKQFYKKRILLSNN